MSGNIDAKKSSRDIFIENRNDLLLGAVTSAVVCAVTGAATIMTESPIVGAAALLSGAFSVYNTRELCNLMIDRRREKRCNPE